MPPLNDDFANATLLTPSAGSVFVDNTTATAESPDPLRDGGYGQQTVWFKIPLGTSQIDLWTTPGDIGDTVLAVYEGTTLAGLTQIAFNDDNSGGGAHGAPGFYSELDAVTLDPLLQHYVEVTGYDDSTFGTFGMHWEVPVPTPPSANTTCAAALPISGTTGSQAANNADANDWTAPDPLFSDPVYGLGYGGGGPLWWKYTNPHPNQVLLRVYVDAGVGDSIEEALVGIFRGACGSLRAAEVADTDCDVRSFVPYVNDLAVPGVGPFAYVDAVVAPGETVYIEVDGYSGDSSQPPTLGAPNRGTFKLRWEERSIVLRDALEASYAQALTGCDDLYGGTTRLQARSFVDDGAAPTAAGPPRPGPDRQAAGGDYLEFGGGFWFTTYERSDVSPGGQSLSSASVYRWDGTTSPDIEGAGVATFDLPIKGTRPPGDVMLNTDGETLWAVTMESGFGTGPEATPNPWGFGYWAAARPVVFRFDGGAFVRVGVMTAMAANNYSLQGILTAETSFLIGGRTGCFDSTAHPSMPGRLYVVWAEEGVDTSDLPATGPYEANWVEHMAVGIFSDSALVTEYDVGLTREPFSSLNLALLTAYAYNRTPVFVTQGKALLTNDRGVCQLFRIPARYIEDGSYTQNKVICQQVGDAGLTTKLTIEPQQPTGASFFPAAGPNDYADCISVEPICHQEAGEALRTLIINWVAGLPPAAGPPFTGALAYNLPALLDGPERWYNDNAQGSDKDVVVGNPFASPQRSDTLNLLGFPVVNVAARKTLHRDRFGQTWAWLAPGPLDAAPAQAVFYDRNCAQAWIAVPLPLQDRSSLDYRLMNPGRQVVYREPGDTVRFSTVFWRTPYPDSEMFIAVSTVKVLRKWVLCSVGGLLTFAYPFIALSFRAEEAGTGAADPTDMTAAVHFSSAGFRAQGGAGASADLGAAAVHLSDVRFRAAAE